MAVYALVAAQPVQMEIAFPNRFRVDYPLFIIGIRQV